MLFNFIVPKPNRLLYVYVRAGYVHTFKFEMPVRKAYATITIPKHFDANTMLRSKMSTGPYPVKFLVGFWNWIWTLQVNLTPNADPPK